MSEVKERPGVNDKARMLPPQRLHLAEAARQDFVVNAEEGTTPDDVLDPAYWALLGPETKFQQFDRIEVREETGKWVLMVMVLDPGRTFMRVHPLHLYELTEVKLSTGTSNRHEVQWKGPQRKWIVVRKSDGVPVKEGMSSRGEAEAFMVQHEQVVSLR